MIRQKSGYLPKKWWWDKDQMLTSRCDDPTKTLCFHNDELICLQQHDKSTKMWQIHKDVMIPQRCDNSTKMWVMITPRCDNCTKKQWNTWRNYMIMKMWWLHKVTITCSEILHKEVMRQWRSDVTLNWWHNKVMLHCVELCGFYLRVLSKFVLWVHSNLSCCNKMIVLLISNQKLN